MSYFKCFKALVLRPRLEMRCISLFHRPPITIFQDQTINKYSNSSKLISGSNLKKRSQRRKANEDTYHRQGFWSVTAFTTAEEYRLEELQEALSKTNLYEPTDLYNGSENYEDTVPFDVIHATSKYHVTNENRHLYIFREGSVVGWNISDMEVTILIDFLSKYQIMPYATNVIMDERELMYYTYTNDKKSSIQKGNLHLIKGDKKASDLDRYTFSNAMAHSVKLGTWEVLLDQYIDSIEFVTQDLQEGHPIRITRKEVMRKTGELFGLRHSINLSSDLHDIPDFYWEQEHLETLYRTTSNYFSISTRLKVMNMKLNHCLELVELLSHHLSDRHHIRLEWMIIVLIMVEVGFEILHYTQLLMS
ncbi:required for meiotic nuclear division protein 1 homolog [Daktulosphaira vitifoliae]|uniref:required for meiotic nuclear division protein 1 homolog n=1 Tax=Daktulosphaira vitifoliae TaxID=58002 RepID=UPI0021AA5CE2|nr:required for meiotic nuclear division protein 1 homolog [Daktulosphaira vitifoliae]